MNTNMTDKRKYNVYISGMSKALNEKLFFLSKVNLSDYDTIIDFGCGAGDVLHEIEHFITTYIPEKKIELVGIDTDSYMRNITKTKVKNSIVLSELSREFLGPKTLIIFNSVLHEVEDYAKELLSILNETGSTVAVRDMRFASDFSAKKIPSEDANVDSIIGNLPVCKEDLAKLIKNSAPKILADFVNTHGMNTKQMYHYLLKYTYIDNWALENKENYFSFNYQKLFDLGEVLYERNYVLDYKKEQVKKDFDIDLIYTTHTQLIIKLKK